MSIGQKSRARASGRSTLDRLRARIDKLDREVLERLGERYRVVEEIQRAKQRSGDGVYLPDRERAQLDRLARLNREAGTPVPPDALLAIFGEILSASRALQAALTVAYLGPAGTFAERAARQQFGSSTRLHPARSIAEVFRTVERGDAQFGVVPIENSTEGMVGQTLDMFVTSPLRIVAERELLVRHAILARCRSLRDVARIVSHPQSLAQCREWLARHLPSVPTMEVASNALAAEAASRGKATAAIASRDAAPRYHLRVLADNIQDLPRNVTRFVVLSPRELPGDQRADGKVSVLFSVKNEPGMLYRGLQPLAVQGIDMCKIESRPMRGRPWEYLFFLDFRGDLEDPRVKRAMAVMTRQCIWFKALGSYSTAHAV